MLANRSTEFHTTASPIDANLTYMNYTEGVVALALNKYYLWVLCCFGLVLNASAVLTISKLKPFTTASFYVILLAIFDTLALMAKLSYLQLTYHDFHIGDAGCKLLSFIGSFLDQFSIWILVLLTIERFVAVWLPLKVSCWFTMTRSRFAVGMTALTLLSINSTVLFLLHQVELPKPYGIDCGFYPEYRFFADKVWYWVESCLTGLFPCAILTVLNSLIIYRMRQSIAEQKHMLSGTENNQTSYHKTHLTVMLVTVSVSFVMMMLPLAVFNSIRSTWVQNTPYDRAKFFLTREITHMLADCNHGLNFLFYFLSSRRFREIFYRLLRCRFGESHRPLYSSPSKMSYYKYGNVTVNSYCATGKRNAV